MSLLPTPDIVLGQCPMQIDGWTCGAQVLLNGLKLMLGRDVQDRNGESDDLALHATIIKYVAFSVLPKEMVRSQLHRGMLNGAQECLHPFCPATDM